MCASSALCSGRWRFTQALYNRRFYLLCTPLKDFSMTSTAQITRRQAWMLAARPKTLPAAVAPVLVGTAMAIHDGVFRPLPAFAALLGSLLLQIGVNLANDYFDFV